MRERHQLGVICGSLTQAGGGRYAYELCRSIDKDKFKIDLLTIAPWGVGRQYYGERIRKMGVRISPIFALFYFRRLPRVLRRAALSVQNTYRKAVLPNLLARYDLIVSLSLDHFLDIEFMLPRDKRIVVHLMNYLHQYSRNRYLEWPVSRSGFLVCMHWYQDQEATTSIKAAIRDKIHVPLPIDASQFEQIKDFPKSRLVIGCFKRIDDVRHFTALLRAFKRVGGCVGGELRFYGNGNVSEIRSEANRLGILDRVTFPGHTFDIRQAVLEDGVNVAWLPSFDEFLGYSGIELGLLGVPTLFLNVGRGASANEIRRLTQGAVHSYCSEEELADATLRIWLVPELAESTAHNLREFLVREHDLKSNLRLIETFYERVIQSDGVCSDGDQSSNRTVCSVGREF